jgi:hypothetical protein
MTTITPKPFGKLVFKRGGPLAPVMQDENGRMNVSPSHTPDVTAAVVLAPGAATLTADHLRPGTVISMVPAATVAVTLPTLAELETNTTAGVGPVPIGTTWWFTLANMATATHALTFTPSADVVFSGAAASISIAAATSRNFRIRKTSAVLYTVY